MMKNWRLKLGSLLAAICLAIFVNYFFTPTEFGASVVQLIAPVEIRNVPDNKSVIWPAARQVELTVQGSSLFLSKVALSPPVVRVVMPEGSDKKFVVKLNSENINLPATVKLLGIKPAELEFALDDIIEKTLPVVVPQIGLLAPELKLEKVNIDPSHVTLKGPSQELKNAVNIETNPVNLAEIDKNTVVALELRMPGSLVESDLKSVKVTVEVSDAIGEVSFSNVVVLLDIQNESLNTRNPRLSQKGVAVILRGPKKVLRNIKKEFLNVRAQINSQNQSNDSIELTMDPIEAVDSAIITPRKVTLTLDPELTPTPSPAKTVNSKAASKTKKVLSVKN